MQSYKIFVVFHDKIDLSYFAGADLDHFCFINVNPANKHIHPSLPVINLYELPGFIPLGKWYTESEVIYNVYRNPGLMEGQEYIGFIHYDIDVSPIDDEFLRSHLGRYELINFQPMSLRADFNQRILMDPEQPDTLSGPGKNCYLTIFEDFNQYYGTGYSYESFMDAEINLCSCFLMKADRFLDMMAFASVIIESGKLNAFDSRHKYRIQGGYLERYYAVWSLLTIRDAISCRLKHGVCTDPKAAAPAEADEGIPSFAITPEKTGQS